MENSYHSNETLKMLQQLIKQRRERLHSEKDYMALNVDRAAHWPDWKEYQQDLRVRDS